MPVSITGYNSNMQSSSVWNDYMQKFWVKDRFIEPYNPQQNPAGHEAVGTQKGKWQGLLLIPVVIKGRGFKQHAMFQMSTIILHLRN